MSQSEEPPQVARPAGQIYGDIWHPRERMLAVLMHLSSLFAVPGTTIVFDLGLGFILFYTEISTSAFMWLTGLLSYVVLAPIANSMAPLIVWLIVRRRSDMVDFHGRRTVNFQISMSIYMVVILAAGIGLFFLGIQSVSGDELENGDTHGFAAVGVAILTFIFMGVCLFILGIMWLVSMIIAAVRAARGKSPGYILAIPFLR